MPTLPFFKTLHPLVLASGSPRRIAFLGDCGLNFEIIPAQCPEPRPLPGESPQSYTLRTAETKARFVASRLQKRTDSPAILSADTAVIIKDEFGEEILGKPESPEGALKMLQRLSGKTHQVFTACCLLFREKLVRFESVTDVTFASWPISVLKAYVASGDPLDKAGSYGMQSKGAFLVKEIHGSDSTVVGLPLDKVLQVLLEEGIIAC